MWELCRIHAKFFQNSKFDPASSWHFLLTPRNRWVGSTAISQEVPQAGCILLMTSITMTKCQCSWCIGFDVILLVSPFNTELLSCSVTKPISFFRAKINPSMSPLNSITWRRWRWHDREPGFRWVFLHLYPIVLEYSWNLLTHLVIL